MLVSFHHMLFWNVLAACVLPWIGRELRGGGQVEPTRLFTYVASVYILAMISEAIVLQNTMTVLRGGRESRQWEEDVLLEDDEEDNGEEGVGDPEAREAAFLARTLVSFRSHESAVVQKLSLRTVLEISKERLKIVLIDGREQDLLIHQVYEAHHRRRARKDLLAIEAHNGIFQGILGMLKLSKLVTTLDNLMQYLDDARVVVNETASGERGIRIINLVNGRQFKFRENGTLIHYIGMYMDNRNRRYAVREPGARENLGEWNAAGIVRYYENIDLSVFDPDEQASVAITPWQLKKMEYREPQFRVAGSSDWLVVAEPMVQSMAHFADR